jgi:hypothetical protein
MAHGAYATCTTEREVTAEYERVAGTLRGMLDALKRITTAAVRSMPRTSGLAVPRLYSGQVEISNLGEPAFARHFLEYPGNAGPPPATMGMPLDRALRTFLAPGQTVTLKSFLSTTDSQQDALHYSNGILLQIDRAPSDPVWPESAYITPLSDEADKTEYLFAPASRFQMSDSHQETIGGKLITVINMTELPSA